MPTSAHSYSSPRSFVKMKGFVRKVSFGNSFHNPNRIAIATAVQAIGGGLALETQSLRNATCLTLTKLDGNHALPYGLFQLNHS